MFCISSAAAWGWGSCGFHGLDEFTEVRVYDEMVGWVNSLVWMRLEWPCNGWRIGKHAVVTPEVTIRKLKKKSEVDRKLQKRISGETGDK